MNDFEQYIRETEPHRREKGEAWQTAIGLQAVDGLKPSDYLVQTAKQHIEGDITIEELLTESAFSFSPVAYIGIHRKLFTGIYKFAGKLRDYNITKKEWVLGGETVLYASAHHLRETLDYDFEQEKHFSYQGLPVEEAIKHIAKFVSGLWQIHPFGEGNTRTTAVFTIQYLRTFGFAMSNEAFAYHSWYFRNALVRANYNNLAKGITATAEYIERFFRNLILGEENELKNRHLLVGDEFQSAKEQIPKGKICTLNCTLEEFGNMKEIQAERSNVSKWERGASLPNRIRLEKIARIGNITFNQLVYGSVDEFLQNNFLEIVNEKITKVVFEDVGEVFAFKKDSWKYILSNLRRYSKNEDNTDLLEDITYLSELIATLTKEFISIYIMKFIELISQNRDETNKALKDYFSETYSKKLRTSTDIQEKIKTVDNLLNYLNTSEEADLIKNYGLFRRINNLVVERVKADVLYTEKKTTLYITLSNILENNVDLHTENFIGFDFKFRVNLFLQNKYGIDDYNIMVGLKIEKENSLYYLANYPRIEDVPLNTEAQYFILNHDNSYFISKITEKPDCKYLAPILGKME